MDREVEALKNNLYQMCWYMRGGITIEQLYLLEPNDRVIISSIIKGNLETTKESGLPFF
jgi:hypothetical protein